MGRTKNFDSRSPRTPAHFEHGARHSPKRMDALEAEHRRRHLDGQFRIGARHALRCTPNRRYECRTTGRMERIILSFICRRFAFYSACTSDYRKRLRRNRPTRRWIDGHAKVAITWHQYRCIQATPNATTIELPRRNRRLAIVRTPRLRLRSTLESRSQSRKSGVLQALRSFKIVEKRSLSQRSQRPELANIRRENLRLWHAQRLGGEVYALPHRIRIALETVAKPKQLRRIVPAAPRRTQAVARPTTYEEIIRRYLGTRSEPRYEDVSTPNLRSFDIRFPHRQLGSIFWRQNLVGRQLPICQR